MLHSLHTVLSHVSLQNSCWIIFHLSLRYLFGENYHHEGLNLLLCTRFMHKVFWILTAKTNIVFSLSFLDNNFRANLCNVTAAFTIIEVFLPSSLLQRHCVRDTFLVNLKSFLVLTEPSLRKCFWSNKVEGSIWFLVLCRLLTKRSLLAIENRATLWSSTVFLLVWTVVSYLCEAKACLDTFCKLIAAWLFLSTILRTCKRWSYRCIRAVRWSFRTRGSIRMVLRVFSLLKSLSQFLTFRTKTSMSLSYQYPETGYSQNHNASAWA
jgi:hypothetical protein